ncbi:GPI ethanolamine phosphate transferase 1-like [Tribolium madens]|uniref:GPI ethanolamine phosphate transferase 1-like n=1 Tax=Tribolium madens TaxID=41895 RepID=UPI001CF74026|nr:GPI ethanolamine phosphate transferase 1-like [Tribolium madens]
MHSRSARPRERCVFSLIVLCVFVHILVLKAAFDIYFSSPIDYGMTPMKSTEEPPAKRLVFIVADGLRAEGIFGKGQAIRAPNLTKIRKSRASWGVAHTRIPTESRSGHVALLAGIFEDPAAIFLGWSGNPVNFDSVINQSTNAWCWGSPHIVHMFNKDNLPHIHSYSFDSVVQDFRKNDTILMDSWVFDQVHDFIEEKMKCEDCCDFHESGNVFFLHLRGVHTAGHDFKPNSLEYKNIKFVDSIIPKVEKLFETAFPDKSTAYVFTSDHGMTNSGSHGAGSKNETEIPFIAWGAGIKIEDMRKDIRQVDVAPLISALIGINYPINSVGTLPRDLIDTSEENLSEMLFSNVRQLTEIYLVKKRRRMNNAIRFIPYQGIGYDMISAKLRQLEDLLDDKKFAKFNHECELFITYLIQGADYYHNYYQVPILIAVTIGLAAFIIYVAIYNMPVRRHSRLTAKIIRFIEIFLFIPTYLNTLFILNVQALPLMYYLYFLFPLGMIHALVRQYPQIAEATKYIKRYGVKDTVTNFVLYIAGLRLLVQTLHDRVALTVIMIFMGMAVYFSTSLRRNTIGPQKITWVTATILLASFPLMPIMRTAINFTVYMMGYVLWWMTMDKLIARQLEYPFYNLRLVEVVDLQHIIFKITPLYTLAVQAGIVASDSHWKYLAWIWAFYPIAIIPCSSPHIFVRLTSIFIGFAPFYLMVTTNFEVLFLMIFVLWLYAWLMIESKCYGHQTIYRLTFTEEFEPNRRPTANDFRRGFFFLVMIFMGFFGTGSIASVSSFDPMWVRSFLTVYSPLTMAGLILLRVVIPFIYTSCTFRAINIFRKGSTLSMFCIILMFSDVMLMELFFTITNIGTWLEIGTSFSRFIIMQLFVLALLVLYGLGYYLTTIVYTLRLNYVLYHY